ncbi:hypothetical protein DPMN_103470 [Dreissena polymorpha]|uniref:Uncharacterized protein n=1 Tax=Dreissena polymorpha TaxID=45954 RepID=A0A9D4H842_DREPO|nr:hypothetical protein DPMN_103470 [Dreissena polymorpha]
MLLLLISIGRQLDDRKSTLPTDRTVLNCVTHHSADGFDVSSREAENYNGRGMVRGLGLGVGLGLGLRESGDPPLSPARDLSLDSPPLSLSLDLSPLSLSRERERDMYMTLNYIK